MKGYATHGIPIIVLLVSCTSYLILSAIRNSLKPGTSRRWDWTFPFGFTEWLALWAWQLVCRAVEIILTHYPGC